MVEHEAARNEEIGATIVLHDGDVVVGIGHTSTCGPCDFALVDSLARLALGVRRLGWTMELRDVVDDLADLFELAGLADLVSSRRADDRPADGGPADSCPTDQAPDASSIRGGSPKSANSSG
jgi:hypothetical protein